MRRQQTSKNLDPKQIQKKKSLQSISTELNSLLGQKERIEIEMISVEEQGLSVKDEYRKEREQLESLIEQSDLARQKFVSERELADHESKTFTSRLSDLKGQCDLMSTKLDKIMREYNRLNSLCDEKNAEISQMTSGLSDLSIEKSACEKIIDEHLKSKEKLENQISLLSSDQSIVTTQLEKTRQELKEERDKYQENVSDNRHEMEKLNDMKVSLMHEINTHQLIVKNVTEVISSLDQQRNDLITDVDRQKSHLSEVKQKEQTIYEAVKSLLKRRDITVESKKIKELLDL